MEIKKREDIPENRQVRLTVTVDRDTWQAALMHCYNGIKSLCPVEGEPTREKIEAARARIAAQVAKNAEESAAAASEEIPVEVAQDEAPAAGASEGEQA